MDGDCCAPTAEEAHYRNLESRVQEGLETGDAAMASCCARELSERKEAGRVLGILKAADVSTRHEREKFKATPNALAPSELPPPVGSPPRSESSDFSDFSDDDEDLARIRAQRMEELMQAKRQTAKTLLCEGRVQSVDNEVLRKILQRHAGQMWQSGFGGGGGKGSRSQRRPALVCQFCVKGDAFSNELSEVVDALAARDFAKTHFVRIEKTKGVVVNQRDKVNQAALCCFEAGQHKCVLFGEEIGAPDVDERVIVNWLTQVCGISKSGSASGAQAAEEDDGDGGDGGIDPCEICGRSYPHEHIKSVYGNRSDSDSNSDSENLLSD